MRLFGIKLINFIAVALLISLFIFTGESSFLFATVVPFSEGYDTSGTPGKRAKTGSFQERSKITEEIIKFGRAVALGTSGDQIKALSANTDIFAGITVFNYHSKGVGDGQYLSQEAAVIAYEGIYWVRVDEAVDEKDPVRVRIVDHATDPLLLKGNFCSTADVGKTLVLKGAYFDSSRSDAGAVAIRLSDSIELVAD